MQHRINELKNNYGMETIKFFACIAITVILYLLEKNDIVFAMIQSNHLSDALTGILTFSTLMVGFLGVLLPAVISTRKDSTIIKRFLDTVPPKRFSAFIRNNIVAGLFLNICAIAMFFCNDLLTNEKIRTALAMGWITIFCIVYFIVTTFCVLNILLRLLIENID